MKRTVALGLLTAAAISLATPATSVAQEQPAPGASSQAWVDNSSVWGDAGFWLYNPAIALITPLIAPFVSLFLSTSNDRLGAFWGSSDIPFLGRS